ncbi:MAG: hypothetical protein JSS97_00995 [Actinobacteria bacterium]|nr:hypothetical protein [Actinomycetota bacterium]
MRLRHGPRRRARADQESVELVSSFEAYVARNEAGERYARLLMVFSGTAILALLCIAIVTNSQAAGLALAIPIVFFAYAFQEWQEARGGRESLRHDVIALSNVLYQDASTIARVLNEDMIHEYLQNLLQAALHDTEFGKGYWKQAVRPFIEASRRGFREDWRYSIDLARLPEDIELELPGADPADSAGRTVAADDYWRLSTVVSYRQHLMQSPKELYVGCVFSDRNLPDWFREEGFLLRELVCLPSATTAAFAGLDSGDLTEPSEGGGEVAATAGKVFGVELKIGGEEFEPVGVDVSELGIRWKYKAADLTGAEADLTSVRIAVETVQPRSQLYFPVHITHATRHPTIQFTYAQTGMSPDRIEADVFLSSEEPYRAELIEHHQIARRIDVQTNRDDWVFAGSGCMFSWSPPSTDGEQSLPVAGMLTPDG